MQIATTGVRGAFTMTKELQNLRLFPLSLVLFPGISIPLHIFEDRYKQMVNECLDADEPFGIVLDRRYRRPEMEAEPCAVGCLARITSVERLEEGRMNIVVEGQQRFRILEILQGRPYLSARVQLMAELGAPGASPATDRLAELFECYIERLVTLAGRQVEVVEVPDDAATLFALVAALLAIPLEVRQELLEAEDLASAMVKEASLLEEQIAQLDQAVPAHRTTRLNGAEWAEVMSQN